MITLIPINQNIQKTLHEKIGMLSRDIPTRPINETQTEEEGAPIENYMFTRVPFLRAVSFTQHIKSKNKVVILSGGKISKWGRLPDHDSETFVVPIRGTNVKTRLQWESFDETN